jgi:hypothetical protein
MSEKIEAGAVSRRTAFWILGVGAAFGAGLPASLLTAPDAEAQTAGMERRHERREARQENRENRREARHGGSTGETASSAGTKSETKSTSTGETKAASPGETKSPAGTSSPGESK